MKDKGKFVVLEGGPGSGKTSFVTQFKAEYGNDYFRNDNDSKKLISGGRWLWTREPGGTPFGEIIRNDVQGFHDHEISPRAALFGYNTARANSVDIMVRPRLQEGVNVMCDRYFFSSIAYQGAEGLPKWQILFTCLLATNGLMPDLTLFFKVDPEVGQKRKGRSEDLDRYDVKEKVFFGKVMKNYQMLGMILRPKWEIIDASKSQDEVYAQGVGIMRRRGIIK